MNPRTQIARPLEAQRWNARMSHMRPDSAPAFEALRRYRVSLPGHAYFITLCTKGRRRSLQNSEVTNVIKEEIRSLEGDGTLRFHAGVIMPDHLHLLIVAYEKLTLGQIVGRMKFKSRTVLSNHQLEWQGNFFEHRLRSSDRIEDVVRYMYLNPHRSEMAEVSRDDSLFWMSAEVEEWFRPLLDQGRPFPEWLRD
jgi:Transposase and inactivated derivatives